MCVKVFLKTDANGKVLPDLPDLPTQQTMRNSSKQKDSLILTLILEWDHKIKITSCEGLLTIKKRLFCLSILNVL